MNAGGPGWRRLAAAAAFVVVVVVVLALAGTVMGEMEL